jgi:hypothetical protein
MLPLDHNYTIFGKCVSHTVKGKGKGKLVPVSRSHKGKIRKKYCFSTHFQFRHQMEISGHIHENVALMPGTEPQLPFGEAAAWDPVLV